MRSITAAQALFIKLGEQGRWEAECLQRGTLRLGYREIDHSICASGRWGEAERLAAGFSKDKGAATRHVKQVRLFYEADERVLWITFHSDRLWWCFSNPGVGKLPSGDKERTAISGWSDKDRKGEHLLKGRLSGKLLAVQGFQGTICSVPDLDYLMHKLNGTMQPHVAHAQARFDELRAALIPIIKQLHPKDLETFTDLIFRQSGWQRVGVVGETEKDIDLDLLSPVTQERVAVQVKSKASDKIWADYRRKYADMRGYARFYFVTHTPTAAFEREAREDGPDENFVLWGPEQLAWHAVRGGLTGWLLDKVA